MNKKYIYIIMFVLAVTFIISGIVIVLLNKNNSEPTDIINNVNINENKTDVEKMLKNVITESKEDSTEFYYESEQQNNEKVYIFSVKTEEQIRKENLDESIYDIEYINEIEGIKYYCVTGTGTVIDNTKIQEQLADTTIDEQTKNNLRIIMNDNKNIQEIYHTRKNILN